MSGYEFAKLRWPEVNAAAEAILAQDVTEHSLAMRELFKQFGLFDGRYGLLCLVVVDQDHFYPRWVEQVTLAADSNVPPVFIQNPELVAFFA